MLARVTLLLAHVTLIHVRVMIRFKGTLGKVSFCELPPISVPCGCCLSGFLSNRSAFEQKHLQCSLQCSELAPVFLPDNKRWQLPARGSRSYSFIFPQCLHCREILRWRHFGSSKMEAVPALALGGTSVCVCGVGIKNPGMLGFQPVAKNAT